jgi:curli biogenesis system outer membrane secretion channel CsgG
MHSCLERTWVQLVFISLFAFQDNSWAQRTLSDPKKPAGVKAIPSTQIKPEEDKRKPIAGPREEGNAQREAPGVKPGPNERGAPKKYPIDFDKPAGVASRIRLQIAPFDDAAVKSDTTAIFGTGTQVGSALSSLLAARVRGSGAFVAMKATAVPISREQDFSTSTRVKSLTQTGIDRMSGTDYLLYADIVQFGRDYKKAGTGIGAFKGLGGLGKVGGSVNSQDKARVTIVYRLIDAMTSQVVSTGSIDGESTRKAKVSSGMYRAQAKTVRGLDLTSENFKETIIGEATYSALDRLSQAVERELAGLPRKVEGKVADAGPGSVILNIGANEGVNAGDRFEILRIVRELRDPLTAESLDRETEKVGEIVVNEARPRIAIGSLTDGSQPSSVAEWTGYVARRINK